MVSRCDRLLGRKTFVFVLYLHKKRLEERMISQRGVKITSSYFHCYCCCLHSTESELLCKKFFRIVSLIFGNHEDIS